MKCLAATQGPKIRINAVLPGLLLTEWVSPTCLWLKPKQVALTTWQGQNFTPERIQAVKDKAILKKEVECFPSATMDHAKDRTD